MRGAARKYDVFHLRSKKHGFVLSANKSKKKLDLFTKSYSTRTIPLRSPYAAVTSIFKNVSKTSGFSTNSTRTQPVRTRTLARANPYDSRTLPVRLIHAMKPLVFQQNNIPQGALPVRKPYATRTQPLVFLIISDNFHV